MGAGGGSGGGRGRGGSSEKLGWVERKRATSWGEDHRLEVVRWVGRLGQLKRWDVVSGWVEQWGRRRAGSTLMRWR